MHAGGLHAWPADAESLEMRDRSLQSIKKMCPEEVTGGFAGHQGNSNPAARQFAHDIQRMMLRLDESRNVTRLASSAHSAVWPRNVFLASSSDRPDRYKVL